MAPARILIWLMCEGNLRLGRDLECKTRCCEPFRKRTEDQALLRGLKHRTSWQRHQEGLSINKQAPTKLLWAIPHFYLHTSFFTSEQNSMNALLPIFPSTPY